ncbi:hypothetical protein J7M28_12260 [bacterium]|nr:hypothetical protein [bacterium]
MPDLKSAKPCVCGQGPTLIFSCSGASDVGAITDLAARALARGRNGFMCCAAAIAAVVGRAQAQFERSRAARERRTREERIVAGPGFIRQGYIE